MNWAQRLDNDESQERIGTLDPSSIHVNTTDMNIPEPLMVISNEPIDYDILNDCLEDGTNRWTQEKKGRARDYILSKYKKYIKEECTSMP